MPIRAIVTDGTRADCKEAIPLIQNLPCKVLLADRGYDSDEIVEHAKNSGIRKRFPSAKALPARNRNPLRQKTFVFCRFRSSCLPYGLA